MKVKINIQVLSVWIILAFMGLYIIFIKPQLTAELDACYNALTATYFFISLVIAWIISRSDFDIFEPIVMLLALYMAIFVYRPIVDIINNDYYTFGVNPMNGCVKSCIIICVSVLAFCVGYYNYFKVGSRIIPDSHENQGEKVYDELSELEKHHITKIALYIWIVSAALSILNLIISGKSIAYIFSLGTNGLVADDSTSSGIAALTYFAYSMLAPWLYICICSKSRLLKIITTVTMLCIFIVRGTRIVLLIMITAPILYYYNSRKKRPKLVAVLIGCVLVLMFMSVMQMMRYGIRTGAGVETGVASEGLFTNVFDSDLTTYKQFYAIVAAYPSTYEFTFGRAMILQTILTMIPRAIWPGKPEAVITSVITNAVNETAAISGMASPGIGEYYFEFGVIGCVVCMFILGVIFHKWKMLYVNNPSLKSCIEYGVLYGLIFQIITRTSTASCVYQYLFSVIPILIICNSAKKFEERISS
ncbi:MAG: oligosaccharide repeat unit polymerase [Oscillospiraceae bacterium]|nr:oligosaccharide repeat unit polymerase [Oscillospiraceae bacterium]